MNKKIDEAVVKMYEGGNSLSQISQELYGNNKNTTQVRRILERNDIELRKSNVLQKANEILNGDNNKEKTSPVIDAEKEKPLTKSEVLEQQSQKIDNFFQEMKCMLKKDFKPIEIKDNGKNQELTGVAVLSDWHIEEVVDPDKIHGLNKFDDTIAEQRAKTLFENLVRLIKKEDKMGNLVICLGGDFISGYIHPELMEGNSLSPVKAIWKCYQIIRSGIEYVLKNTGVMVKVPCVVGNHGRTSEKRVVATATENSFEWLMYMMLARDFENDKRVDFLIAEGKMTYFKIYDYMVRLTHGDQIKGGGGIGGIAVPILRKISQWDKSRHADITTVGHFHQMVTYKNAVVNGSLIGFNTFAEEIGAGYEEPSQTFFIVDRDHGRTTTCPIFLEDKDQQKL